MPLLRLFSSLTGYRKAFSAAIFGLFLGSATLPVWARPCLPQTQIQSSTAQNPAANQTRDEWLGMYMGKKKIGYSNTHITPTTYNGKPALEQTSQGSVQLTVLGSSVEQKDNSRSITDLDSRPLKQIFHITSNGSAIHVEATYDYEAGKVNCVSGEGSDATKKTLDIPMGANLASDSQFLATGKKLSVGQKVSFYYLEPLSVTLQEAHVEVTGRETIKDSLTGKRVSVLVVSADTGQGKIISWETETGETLRGELRLGPISLTMVRETKQVALDMTTIGTTASGEKTYTPPADFAVATAIQADKKITKPREVRTLTVTVSGVPDKRLVLSDARQKAEILSVATATASLKVRYTIEAAHFGATDSASAPVTTPDMAEYLSKAASLETEDPEIKATAARLRGDETNLYRIACTLRDWVHENMTPDASIGVPRTARDIFHRRRGVCRDYATLYTSLARAAGVPTRLCGGIVYAEGRFFYHAWAESYVGRWIAFDPTLYDPAHPMDFVDATHIKFAQGDVAAMFGVVSVIGKLRIAVQGAVL